MLKTSINVKVCNRSTSAKPTIEKHKLCSYESRILNQTDLLLVLCQPKRMNNEIRDS